MSYELYFILEISTEYKSCLIIISQKDNSGSISMDLSGLKIKHPVDLGESIEDHLSADYHLKAD